jgi:4,5-DOPA dioxygenase extradiol
MFPAADIPVLQLSLDVGKSGQAHYETGKALAALREEGVLIVGSGNMVHNLRLVVLNGDWPDGINTPFGLDWAIEANNLFKTLIDERDHRRLAEYQGLGRAAQLAINSAEHYLPMLYALALQEPGEEVWYFNDVAVAGSLTMTSFAVS